MTTPRESLQIVFSRLPRWLRNSLRRTRWWLRWAKWRLLAHRGYPNPSLFINEGELLPQFREALRYLQEKMGAENIGDFLEFGVCQGTSLGLMYDELLDAGLNHVRLFGFDSFAGLPHDVEGEWEDVFAAIKRCHEVVHEMGAPRNQDFQAVLPEGHSSRGDVYCGETIRFRSVHGLAVIGCCIKQEGV